ncbi:MAG: SUMF1/EgtB/PvdO family nonheme iron enzyme, partial [Gemmatimonadota bacterium]
LRPGGLPREEIEAVLGPLAEKAESAGPAGSPGRLASHYAPGPPLRLDATEVGPEEGLLAFGPDPLPGAAVTCNLSPTGDLREAAARLFACLHELDRPELTGIAAMAIPHEGLGVAINDRLRRAAAPRRDGRPATPARGTRLNGISSTLRVCLVAFAAAAALVVLLGVLTALAAGPAAAQVRGAEKAPGAMPPAAVERDSIPGSLVSFEMVLLPGGTVEVPGPDGDGDDVRRVEVEPVWIGRTELTWEAYDVFALGAERRAPDGDGARRAAGADSDADADTDADADRGGDTDADAIARPSRPYGAPDYGWGHDGYPTISVARDAAEAFCEWLSAVTGRTYRLPTEAEWLYAARLAVGGLPAERVRLDAIAWHADNAGGTTHPVAAREPDALGLYDLFGNAAEWVATEDGRRVTRGGSFRDPPSTVAAAVRAAQTAAWTERDPQLPPSRWWLSDAPFVGFRIVREATPAERARVENHP